MPDPRALEPIRPDSRAAHLRLHPDQLAALPEHDYDKKLEEMHATLAVLVQHARAEKRALPVNVVASGNSDASGNLTLPVYHVREGFHLEAQLLVIESATYTPATVFTGATAWMGVYQSTDPTATAQGSLLDFWPKVAAAQLVPVATQYGRGEMQIQGGSFLVLRIALGPVSKLVTVRMQGWQIGEQV